MTNPDDNRVREMERGIAVTAVLVFILWFYVVVIVFVAGHFDKDAQRRIGVLEQQVITKTLINHRIHEIFNIAAQVAGITRRLPDENSPFEL